MLKIGHGVFNWSRDERVSNRYGVFYLISTPMYMAACTTAFMDANAMQPFLGKRVRIVCKVLETRDSPHVGDLALGISPFTPNVGEEITLGVGNLIRKDYPEDPFMGIGLQPEDCREQLWIDPRILYRLHDQTVDLYLEETDEPCSPAPEISCAKGTWGTGSGGIQAKLVSIPDRISPTVTSLGQGLFMMSMDTTFGKKLS